MMDAPTHEIVPAPTKIAYGPHPSQFLEVHVPEGGPGPFPAVVLIHGGFWRLPWGLDLMNPLAADLAGRGFAAVNVEYRRLGEDGGGWPGTVEDIAAALRALSASPSDGVVTAQPVDSRSEAVLARVDLARLGIVGHSAGGHLALWAAAQPGIRVRSVVSLAGVTDMTAAARDRLDEEDGKPPAAVELLGGGPEELPDVYRLASPIRLLPLGPGVAQSIVHGDADDRVPIGQSLDYYVAAEAAGDVVSMSRYPTMGHFEVLDPEHASWRASVNHLMRTLV